METLFFTEPKIIQHKEILFALQYRNEMVQDIIIMCKTKYSNKLGNVTKYLAKPFSMQNDSKIFIGIEMLFSVKCNFIIVIPG